MEVRVFRWWSATRRDPGPIAHRPLVPVQAQLYTQQKDSVHLLARGLGEPERGSGHG
jgi:hypothetical protein